MWKAATPQLHKTVHSTQEELKESKESLAEIKLDSFCGGKNKATDNSVTTGGEDFHFVSCLTPEQSNQQK